MNNKKSITWWIGWIVLFPIRIFVMFLVSFAAVIYPPVFYYIMNMKKGEENQDNWRL